MHVAELVRALRARGDVDVQVRCFGAPRDEAGHDGVRRPARARGGERRPADARGRPQHGRRLRRRRPRALAHLVRQHGRPPRLAARRHAARRHRAQPRADAAVEGRAARRRLPRLLVGRARPRTRRAAARHRGQRGHARRHPARAIPSLDPGRVHVVHNGIDSQLWQPRGRGPRRRPPRTASTPTGPRSSSSGGSPGRRACPTCCAPRAQLPPDVQLVLLRRRAGHPGDHGRGRGPDRPSCAASASGVVWIAEMLPRARGRRRCSAAARSSPARRSTSRSASSTSRRWPASWPSSPPRPAASPRSSSTARPAGWCRSSRSRTAPARPVDPDRFVADLAAALTEARQRPGPGPRVRAGRPGPGGRALLLGLDRRPDPRGLPRGPRFLKSG